jgi:DNA polymerase
MSQASDCLNQLRSNSLKCEDCSLSQTRNTVVFGEGPANADVIFIGEAPGEKEDVTGKPFCGRSGALLDQLLAGAGIIRSEVFITSIVKCRPPGNRDPKGYEIEACSGWMEQQVDLIAPKVICTLGNFALHSVRGDKTGITQLHGRVEEVHYRGRDVKLMPLFHPAAALRSTKTKALLAEDLASLWQLLQTIDSS